MKDQRCGCCEGLEMLTPLATANRPGLDVLSYRVGTHATFFKTMLARLSSHQLDNGHRPLHRLTTREGDDPAIALLDGWATVADVLTFYQERIANEGYLHTATERRSVLELARLVGYKLRPGVAASVYLAFTLEQDQEVEIPARTRAQSIPDNDGLPQIFETEEPLFARTEWNAIPARQTRPTVLRAEAFNGTRTLRLQGINTNLKANDVMLFVCPSDQRPQPYIIRDVKPDPVSDTTLVTYAFFAGGLKSDVGDSLEMTNEGGLGESPNELGSTGIRLVPQTQPLAQFSGIVQALRKNPSLPPASRFQLARPLETTFSAASDLGPRLLTRFSPRLKDTLYAAYANAPVISGIAEAPCRVEALRVKAAMFGHNAPEPVGNGRALSAPDDVPFSLAPPSSGRSGIATAMETMGIDLDMVYDGIVPESWVVLTHTLRDGFTITLRVKSVRTLSLAKFGISARVTRLSVTLPSSAGAGADSGVLFSDLSLLRGFSIYAQSEPLELAEELIEDDVAGDVIELDGLYEGLEAGRWLVVSGERTDVPGIGGQGVETSELVMLAGVEHAVHKVRDADGNQIELPTDTLHTHLILSQPLAYTYKRGTVRINANVARATHGETREEVLGSGDGARAFQRFTLKHHPLTHVAAPTPKGVESTLEVRVNDVRWPEHETLLSLGAAERGYLTTTDDDGNTTAVFGDGKHGVRLPTGVENVTAVYRNGIGKAGNVDAGQINVLASRPLGVREVLNPQRASGGADPESRDQARRNTPLAVLALDRLVSVQDYADFARTFAGIAKASASSLTDGRREIVHLTIAGADDAPIDVGSDLHRNLLLALNRFGDPNTPLQVDLREAVFLVLGARIKVLEDYRWNKVEPKLRRALLDTFGFDRRELGQPVRLSEVVGTMQAVEGVDYVDVGLLDAISETDAEDPETLAEKLENLAGASETVPKSASGCEAHAQPRQWIPVHLARIDSAPSSHIRRAQLAYLNPELPDTLILTEVGS